jgi:hypothetical protein
MIPTQFLLNKRFLLFMILLFSQIFFLPACSLKEINEQVQISESVGYINGEIKVESHQKGAVIVLRFRDVEGVPVLESWVNASSEGIFKFASTPGPQYIAAFIDVNNDGKYQPGEHGNYYGLPSIIELEAQQTVTIGNIVISRELPTLNGEVKPIAKVRAVWNNIGQLTNLDDPRFARNNYDLGLWKPFDFLDVAEGGLFFLQEYQEGKVPVLFVHGVKGGPDVWRTTIENLDKERFQPWVLFYPSGLRLDMISDYLVEAISRLHGKYEFNKFNIVAHSMGGLVTRSFVKKYVAYDLDNSGRLGLVMTINSPMAGMAAAAGGVKYSPIVIPSWRDVEPNSDFLKGINSWSWPADVPFHLVFSYEDGKSGDGVVPLQSQIPLKFQAESARMYAFNNNHVGTLNDKDFHLLLNRVMTESL